MLLDVINKKNIDQFDILYFEFPISLLKKKTAVFTDAAANASSAPNFYSDPQDLDKLNWGEINSQQWGSSTTAKPQRMAEAFVYKHVPLSKATNCVVFNNRIERKVKSLTHKTPDFPKIIHESRSRYHYYRKFLKRHYYPGEKVNKRSVVSGPKETASILNNANKIFENNAGKINSSAKFSNISALLDGLRKNFGCLYETSELIGLETVNEVHQETIDQHTKQVVRNLVKMPGFNALRKRFKNLVELAAFLHDIGKGPKERWWNQRNQTCLQDFDPNHPVGAVPMVVRILTQEIQYFKLEDAKLLTKLVCHHDLIGDTLNGERLESQIVQVVDNKKELSLLFLIGKADATALSFHWDEEKANELFDVSMQGIRGK